MILGYRRKFISQELKKLNIFASPRQVTEEDVRLVEKIRREQLRKSLFRDRMV